MPTTGEKLLDIGCGPLEDSSYVALSEGFSERHCLDVSLLALNAAQCRIGKHGIYHHGDFLEIAFGESDFDCILSLHSLYHIDALQQKAAVLKMLKLARPGAPVLIAYKHNDSLLDTLPDVQKFFGCLEGRSPTPSMGESPPYAHTNSHGWWEIFKDVSDVKIYPLHTFDVGEQRSLFPDNEVGRAGFALLASLEDRYPDLFARVGKYCLIVLRRLV